MTITRDADTLVVEAPSTRYVIEPTRFELGLTRIGMVDDHLARLVRDARQTGRPRSRDVETLLDARMTFLRSGDLP